MDIRIIRQIRNALKHKDPIGSMFNLIPNEKLDQFKKFASQFGYSNEKIDEAIKKYRNEKDKSKEGNIRIIRQLDE